MLFDTHCHIDVPPLELDEARLDATIAGVLRALAIGVTADAWDGVASRRAGWPGLDIAIGLHPQALPELDPPAIETTLASLSARAVALGAAAIGECGLDGPVARSGGASLEQQTEVLDAHVEVARALGVPLVLHVLDAHGAALKAIKRHARLPQGGVVHAWSGSPELALQWVKLGFSIAIGPSVLFAGARRPSETAATLPAHAIVLETDAPFSYPPGATDHLGRPRTGRISDLCAVAARVAELRGTTLEALAALTTTNAERLFGRRADSAQP